MPTCSTAFCPTSWATTGACPRSSFTSTSIVKHPSRRTGQYAYPISRSPPALASPEALSRAPWHTFRIANLSPPHVRTPPPFHSIASSGLGCVSTARGSNRRNNEVAMILELSDRQLYLAINEL